MVSVVTGSGVGLVNSSKDVLGGAGELGNSAMGRAGERVTVNAADGNLVVQDRDEYLVGAGPNVDLLRTYNSQGAWDGDNGDNWRIGYYRRIWGLTGTLNTAGSTVKRTNADGHDTVYTYSATTANYVAHEGSGQFDTLTYASSAWTFADGTSGTQESYASVDSGVSYRLTQVQDPEGHRVVVGYNQLATVVTGGATTSYGFDPRGNLTSKGAQTFGFDLGNRLNSSSLGGSYAYDGLGRRFKIVSSDGSTRIQVYSQAGQLLWATSTGGARPASTTAYVYLGGKEIAETSLGVTQYPHTDALGSPVAHTSSAGTAINRSRFEPYGYVAQGTKPSPSTSVVGFTGHVQDAETDLVYMQQRYYDPIAGRFLSVDPVVTDANTGKGFGPYAYVDNNPFSKVDPDGRDPVDPSMLKNYEKRIYKNPETLIGQDPKLNEKKEAQCVELPKQTVGENKSTGTWLQGPKVDSETPRGTAVASGWNKDGTFPAKETGQHAGLLDVPTRKDGSIRIVDQWVGRPPDGKIGSRDLREVSFTHPTPSNNAKDFYVIMFQK